MSPRPKQPTEKAHPLVQLAFQLMEKDNRDHNEIFHAADMDRGTFLHWRNAKRDPTLSRLESLLGTLGYKLIAVPKKGRRKVL